MRLLLLAVSGAAAVAGLIAAFVIWPAPPPAHKPPPVRCLRYFLLPAELICGPNVYLVLHGRRQYVGRTAELVPMPKPPARRG